MRLSIECNGCKATLTSGSGLATVATEAEKAKIKKERRAAERGVSYGAVARDSPSKHFSEKNYKKSSEPNNNNKKKKSLSDFFELSSPSSMNKCSNEEGEEEMYSTRFSSRRFSSDSSQYYGKIRNKNKQKGNAAAASAAAAVEVSRGVAVVEQSSDPYGDFRRSMVEMIMARQKLGAGDLNRLLRSYLTLNPPQHHPVILKAFSDLFIGGSVEHLIS